MAEALHVAHEAGIVHRDLKPANILIRRLGLRPDPSSNPGSNRNSNTDRDGVPTYDPDGLPRVMDFGMAKRDAEAEYVLTQAGQLLGSRAYIRATRASASQDAGEPGGISPWTPSMKGPEADATRLTKRTGPSVLHTGRGGDSVRAADRRTPLPRRARPEAAHAADSECGPAAAVAAQQPSPRRPRHALPEVPGERPVPPFPHRRRPRPRTPPLPPRRANPLPPHHAMGTCQEVVPTQVSGRVIECGRRDRAA